MSEAASTLTPTDEFRSGLQKILGPGNVLLDQADREFFSTDLSFRPREVAAAIIRPTSVESLAEAVAFCTSQGC